MLASTCTLSFFRREPCEARRLAERVGVGGLSGSDGLPLHQRSAARLSPALAAECRATSGTGIGMGNRSGPAANEACTGKAAWHCRSTAFPCMQAAAEAECVPGGRHGCAGYRLVVLCARRDGIEPICNQYALMCKGRYRQPSRQQMVRQQITLQYCWNFSS